MSTDTKQTHMTTDEDSIALDDAGDVRLPIVDVLTGRGFITGKSGSGKSNTASVVVEELLSAGFPVLVVDTDGEYWGLKEDYEVLHVGADEECDLQVGPEHAEKLASLALDQNVPIILDVSGYLDEDDANDLIQETAGALFAKEKKAKKPFLMLVEEVHEYIPEGGGLDETGQMLVKIGKRGRKHGLGLVGISQRPADVKKDFITQCDWLVWHRLTWENDTNVVRRVVDSETADAVADLADGEAFLMADWSESDIQRVQVRRKQTFDAGATPDLGDFERPELKSVSGDLVAELEDISDRKRREENRIEQLEQRLDEKDERISELEDELDNARDLSDMAKQFTQAMMTSGGDAGELEAKVDEITEEKNAEIRRLKDEKGDLGDELDSVRQDRQELRERVSELEEYESAVEHMDELREGVQRMAEALGVDTDGDDARLRRKLERKEERVSELETKIERLEEQGYSLDEEFTEKMDFLKHAAVRNEVQRAASKTKTKESHTWDVLSVLVDKDECQTDEIEPFVDVSSSSVSAILKQLRTHGVVSRRKRGKKHHHSLNIDGMKDIIQQQQKREEMQKLKEEVRS